jgi:hypothetical protein
VNERDIFLSAVEIEDPSARQAFLHSACAGDTNLLASVEALLASHGQSQFLNTPVVAQMSNAESAETMLVEKGSTADGEYPDMAFHSHSADTMKKHESDDENPLDYLLGFLQPPTRPDSKGRLAHYEIIEVLGKGAFGTVLKAFDSKLERVVALTHLDLSCTAVTTIEVLKEMPLKDLSLDRTPVADLSPPTGKAFKSLHFGGTKVKSLSDVHIASSEVIHCHLTQIFDKDELQRWGVRFLDLWGVPAAADPERLRELKPPLSRVNGKPLEEFLKETP